MKAQAKEEKARKMVSHSQLQPINTTSYTSKGEIHQTCHGLNLVSVSQSIIVKVFLLLQAERDRLEREKQARLDAERKQIELEEQVRMLEEERRRATETQSETQKVLELLNEKVKIAEEEAQTHAKRSLQAEEEIRRVRASAVKVSREGGGERGRKGGREGVRGRKETEWDQVK